MMTEIPRRLQLPLPRATGLEKQLWDAAEPNIATFIAKSNQWAGAINRTD